MTPRHGATTLDFLPVASSREASSNRGDPRLGCRSSKLNLRRIGGPYPQRHASGEWLFGCFEPTWIAIRRHSRFPLPSLPTTIPTEPSSMPGDHRFGLYDK